MLHLHKIKQFQYDPSEFSFFTLYPCTRLPNFSMNASLWNPLSDCVFKTDLTFKNIMPMQICIPAIKTKDRIAEIPPPALFNFN